MSQLTQITETSEIKKGLNRLSLNISESEINEIQMGKTISLEGRGLSEIGSLFILASAISAVNLGKPKKTVTFRDLTETVNKSADCSGLPIYCWNSDSLGKCILYLTLVDGKPGISALYEV
ncbi:MAG: hypothetical protein AB4426_34000 [Xenococcaceae cyanobacterium]